MLALILSHGLTFLEAVVRTLRPWPMLSCWIAIGCLPIRLPHVRRQPSSPRSPSRCTPAVVADAQWLGGVGCVSPLILTSSCAMAAVLTTLPVTLGPRAAASVTDARHELQGSRLLGRVLADRLMSAVWRRPYFFVLGRSRLHLCLSRPACCCSCHSCTAAGRHSQLCGRSTFADATALRRRSLTR